MIRFSFVSLLYELLACFNILHEPLKLLVVHNEAGRGTDQTVNILVVKIQGGRNLHQRHSLVWIGNRCEAGINEIDVGVRGEGAVRIPLLGTQL